MNNINISFKSTVAVIGTVGTWLFGGWDTALMVLMVFVTLDWLTGLVKAWITNTVSSDVGLKGIARKGVIFVVLIVAVLLDRLLKDSGLQIDGWPFRTLVCYFYIANEGISLLENCAVIGLPIPKFLKDALIQLKEHKKDGEVELN